MRMAGNFPRLPQRLMVRGETRNRSATSRTVNRSGRLLMSSLLASSARPVRLSSRLDAAAAGLRIWSVISTTPFPRYDLIRLVARILYLFILNVIDTGAGEGLDQRQALSDLTVAEWEQVGQGVV